MTEIEYQEFVRHCPYDAMGDYSKRRYMRYKGVADSRSKKTGEFVTSCTAVLYVCAEIS